MNPVGTSDTDAMTFDPPLTPVAFSLDSLAHAQKHIERALVYAATARAFDVVAELVSVRNSLLYTHRFLADSKQTGHDFTE